MGSTDLMFQFLVVCADTQPVERPRGDRKMRRMRRTNRRGTTHRRDDRGATLVEAAFVMPVFVLLIFGIFEFAGATMAKTGTSAAVRGGIRMAVVQGNEHNADREILRRIEKEGAGVSQDTIKKIVIWHAMGPNEDVPVGCTGAGGVSDGGTDAYGACNVYLNPQGASGIFFKADLPAATTPAQVNDSNYSDYYFGCTGPSDLGASHKFDCAWPAQNRISSEPSPTITCSNYTPPSKPADLRCLHTDFIGVYVEVQHDFYTGFFGTSTPVKEKVVAAIEPQDYAK